MNNYTPYALSICSLFIFSCEEDLLCAQKTIECIECTVPGFTSNTIIEACLTDSTGTTPGITEEDLLQIMEDAKEDGGTCLASYPYD